MTSPVGHVTRQVLGGALLKGARQDLRAVAKGWRWGRRSLVPRSAEPFQPPRTSEPFPTAWARTPAASVAREGLQKLGLAPLLRSQVAPVVHGLDVLDRLGGPVIFVANHTSHLDTPLILCSLPDRWRRTTAVAAAADYFFDTWWRATSSAMVFNTFPIERRTGSLSSTPGDLLDDGWSIVVFPEGTRSPDGWTRTFRHGAAFLAARHKVPVVPIGIRGSFAAMPRGRGWPVPGRPPVTVRYGQPLRPGAQEGPRELGARIESAVAALIDEDSTTWWDATRRAARGETPSTSGPDVARWRRVWTQTQPPAVHRHRRVWR
ncbi:MAG TPA: lysophospholipid acyltransferase family protein [Actinomycetales bacterium]|nr:lysophospholipid acyltransferase family protein [Actinomycetales bacterium]